MKTKIWGKEKLHENLEERTKPLDYDKRLQLLDG